MDSIITLYQQLVEKVFSRIDDCLPQDKYLSSASKLASVLLIRICRRWRDVAVGTPILWYRLFVDVYDRDWQQTVF